MQPQQQTRLEKENLLMIIFFVLRSYPEIFNFALQCVCYFNLCLIRCFLAAFFLVVYDGLKINYF